jgi:hypothetical protein
MNMPSDVSEKIWRPSENIVTRKIADETILVPISGNLANMQRIFSVNEVGESVWALMDGRRSIKDIKQALMNEFEVKEEQLDADLFEFIEHLRQSGLVLEVPD